VAAVLVHDSPEFAPPGTDLDAVLTQRLGEAVTRVVRALAREHEALDGAAPTPAPDDPWTRYASAADKIVSLGSILSRAAAAGDPDEFWRVRRPFITAVPHLRRFHTTAAPHLPVGMGEELERLVRLAERAVAVRQVAMSG
jgi:hypothetical protein